MVSKSVSSIPDFISDSSPCSEFLLCLSSYLGFSWWKIRACEPNKPSPLQIGLVSVLPQCRTLTRTTIEKSVPRKLARNSPVDHELRALFLACIITSLCVLGSPKQGGISAFMPLVGTWWCSEAVLWMMVCLYLVPKWCLISIPIWVIRWEINSRSFFIESNLSVCYQVYSRNSSKENYQWVVI